MPDHSRLAIESRRAGHPTPRRLPSDRQLFLDKYGHCPLTEGRFQVSIVLKAWITSSATVSVRSGLRRLQTVILDGFILVDGNRAAAQD